MTASASGFEKSGLSSKVYAKFSGGASIASFGDAWKVGSGLIIIGVPPYCHHGSEALYFGPLVLHVSARYIGVLAQASRPPAQDRLSRRGVVVICLRRSDDA